jgi:CHAT domain-containing protein
MAVHDSRKRPARGALAARLAVAGALVGLLTGLWTQRASTTERLSNALLEDRFTLGRLSGQREWGECKVGQDPLALVPRTGCDGLPPRRSWRRRRLDRAADAIAKADSSPEALHSRALLELRLSEDLLEKRLKAVTALRTAVDALPNNAVLLNDLAVAYLALAELDPKRSYVSEALNAVGRAMAADSARLEARFNRALILQRHFLISEAEQAWTRYLEMERDPEWRAEAEQRLEEVRQVPDTTSWDSLITTPPAIIDAAVRTEIRVRVARSLQAARETEFELLAAWGMAELGLNDERARQLLNLTREIGNALTRDRSVALAVSTIDSASGTGRLRTLAAGHAALGESFELYESGGYDEARAKAEEAEALLLAGGSPAARWAVFYQAASLSNLRRYPEATRLLEQIERGAGEREPALLGKSIWARGLIALRTSGFETAVRLYRQAGSYIDTAGEVENQGTIAILIAEALMSAGQMPQADTIAFRALRILAPYQRSKFLGHHLNIMAGTTRTAGLSHAALQMMTEAIDVTLARQQAGVPSASNLALFHAARARDHAETGNWPAAEADVDAAGCWSTMLPDSTGRLKAIVQMTRGQVMRERNPREALPLLKSAARILGRNPTELYLPIALYELARVERAVGNVNEARTRLAQAMDLVAAHRDSFRRPEDQITFFETVENVFDAAVELEVSAGNPATAFAIMERGRVVERAGIGGLEAPRLARIGDELPDRRMLLVEYALLADRMIIWTAARGRPPRQHVVSVSRDSIKTLVGRLGQNSAETAWDTAPGAPLETLFRLLIRPLQPELEGINALTIVRDRELYGVPFAALWDAPRREYLLQRFTLRTAPSAAFYVDAAQRSLRLPDNPAALVVGNPELTPAQRVNLLPLADAEREAGLVSALYPGSMLLTDSAAQRDRVWQQLDEHAVFHFAGHAVFNPEQPGESYLAMTGNGSADDGLMLAREIGELRLSNLQVVVLSACSTLGQRATRTGPAAGLAYSFLRARVPATVSTLWDVSDSGTTPLLADFHRQLAGGVHPAKALQQAQQRAMLSDNPSPRVWAAFVYTGP